MLRDPKTAQALVFPRLSNIGEVPIQIEKYQDHLNIYVVKGFHERSLLVEIVATQSRAQKKDVVLKILFHYCLVDCNWPTLKDEFVAEGLRLIILSLPSESLLRLDIDGARISVVIY